MGLARNFRELDVYQRAFSLAMNIFHASKTWPKEERFALTDQVRRSSRSVGANIAEAWAKRRYPAHFLSKLTDADGENLETRHWVDTAEACGYISADTAESWRQASDHIGYSLGAMMAQHRSFQPKDTAE